MTENRLLGAVPHPADQLRPEEPVVPQIAHPSIQTEVPPAGAAAINHPAQIEEAPVPQAIITVEVAAEILHLTNHRAARAAPGLLPDAVPVGAALHRVPDQVLAAQVVEGPDQLHGNR